MKRGLERRELLFVIISFFVLLIIALALFFPEVLYLSGHVVTSLQNQSVLFNKSDEIQVNLSVNNVTNLSGIQVNVSYNPSMLSYNRTQEGTFLNENGTAITYFNNSQINTTSGHINYIIIFREGETYGVTGNGTLATIYFNATGSGSSYVNITDVLFSDNNGNPISTTIQNTTVIVLGDVTTPAVSLTAPVDNYNTSSQTIAFNASGSDNINLKNLSIYGNWTSWATAIQTNSSPINNTNTTFIINSIPEGRYRWNIYACDNSSNCAFGTNRTLRVDLTAPTATIPFYTNLTQKQSTQNLTLNVSVADALSGLVGSACKINANGTNITVAVSNGWCNSTTIPLTGLSNGNSVINVYANDTVNNLKLNNSYYVQISADATPPTVSLNSPSDNYNTSSTTIAFNATASENVNLVNMSIYGNWTGSWVAIQTNSSPINNTQTTFIISSLPQGKYRWNVYACDNSSNCAFAGSNNTFRIAETTPPTYSNNQVNSTVAGQPTKFSLLVNDDSALQPNGQYIFSTNNTGAWVNESSAGTITYDNTSNSSAASGVGTTFSLNHVQGSLTNGYIVVGIGTDCSAQRNVSSVTYNGTSMTRFVRQGYGGASGNPQVELWGLAVGTKAAGTYGTNITLPSSCNGGIYVGVTSFSGIDQTTSNGTAIGNSGSAGGTQATINVTTAAGDVVVDTIFTAISPTVGSGQSLLYKLAPSGGNILSGSREIATGTTTNMSWTGISDNIYTMAAVPLKVSSGNTYFTSTPQWANVTKNLNNTMGMVIGYQWYLTDNAGNANNTGVFTLTTGTGPDSTSPTVALNTPADNYNTNSQTIAFNATASDNINVANISIYGNWTGAWVPIAINSSPINNTLTSFIINSIPEGKYRWNAYTCDNSSNCAFAASNRTFTVDITGPTITLPFYTNLTQKQNFNTLTLNISISDALSGLTNSDCTINANGTNITLAVSNGWCNSTTISLTGLTDGNYSIMIYANDTLGNLVLNSNYYVKIVSIDVTLPTVALNTPADNYNTNSQTIAFNATASDNINVTNVSIYGNWTGSWAAIQTNSSPMNNTLTTFIINSIPEGKYRWNAYACDNSSNCAFNGSNRTFTVDITSPTTALPFYTNLTQKQNTSSLTLNISVADSGSGLVSSACKINTNGTNITVAVSNGWCNTTAIPLTGLANGNYVINVYVNDTTNNLALNNSYYVGIFTPDTTLPIVTLSMPADNYNTTNQTVVFNATASDDINLKNVSLYGNWTGSWVAIQINSSPVNGSLITFTVNNIPEGKGYIWNVYACDNSSNCAFADFTRTLTVDKTGPAITLASYSNLSFKRSSDSLLINASVIDAGIGANYCTINVATASAGNTTIAVNNGWCNASYSLAGTSEGNQTINIYANDTLNNLALNNSYSVSIDNTAPTISLPFYTNATQKENTTTLTLNVSVADSGSGFTGSACKINANGTNITVAVSSGWCNTTAVPLNGLVNGNYSIIIYANDTLNNLALNNNYYVQIVSIDVTLPAVSLTAPVDNYNTSSQTIAFNASGSDNVNLKNLSIYGNWTSWATAIQTNSSPINNTNTTFIINSIPEGRYRWNIYACDNSSNCAFGTNRTLRVDLTAPTATLPFYTNLTQKQNIQNLTLNVSVADSGSGLVSSACKINANGTNITVAVSNGWCNSTTIPLTGLANGNYAINIYANDTVNNLKLNNSYYIQIVSIDLVPPVVVLNSPADNYNTTSQTIAFNATGSDNINLKNMSIYGNWTSWATAIQTNSSPINNTLTTFIINSIPEGRYRWNVYACDNNSSNCIFAGSNRTITVDLTGPTITLPLYTNLTQKQSTGDLTLNISLADASSGFVGSSCRINVNGTNITVAVSSSWCNTTLDLTGLADGNYPIFVYANDTLNNLVLDNNNYVQIVSIDVTAPTVTLNSPEDSYNTSSQTTDFSATASDNVNVKNMSIYGDWAGSWIANATNYFPVNNTLTMFTIDNIPEGSYNWNVYACDNSSNCEFAGSNRTFTVDLTGPTVRINEPIRGATLSTNIVTINISFSDATVLDNCSYNITNTTGIVIADTEMTCEANAIDYQNISDGSYIITAFANDTVGNSRVTNQSFSIDTSVTPPGGGGPGGGGAPGGGTTNNVTNVTVTINRTETLNITPQSPGVFKSFNFGTGLKQIKIYVKNPVQNVSIIIIQYSAKPFNILEKSGKVYQYLELTPENLGSSLQNATIEFYVNRSWADSNSVAGESISMFKYYPDIEKWKDLNADYTGLDTLSYHYETQLENFSYFAIAEKEQPVKTTENVVSGLAGLLNSIKMFISQNSRLVITILIIAVILVIIILLVLLVPRLRNHSSSNSIRDKWYGG